MYLQKVISKKNLLASWRALTKIAGSASGSGSMSQMYGSPDPNPYQNFLDQQHCTKQDFAAAAKTSVAAAAEEDKPSKKRRSSPSPERGGSKTATKERGRRSASRGVRPSARRSRSRERGKRKDRSRSISPYVLAMERWNKVRWWDRPFISAIFSFSYTVVFLFIFFPHSSEDAVISGRESF